MAIRYASLTGNDNASGSSSSSAWRYIDTSASRLEPGDTLRLLRGTWSHERDVIDSQRKRVPSGTSWEKAITIEANPGDPVRIQPPAGFSGFKVTYGEWGTPAYWIVRNMIFDGSLQPDPGYRRQHQIAQFGSIVPPMPRLAWDAPELLYTSYGAHHVRFERLLCEHTMGCACQYTINGVPVGSSYSTFHEMIDCVFRDVGNAEGDSGHGGPGINNGYCTYTQTDDNLWRGCTFTDARGMGTVCYGSRNRWDTNRWSHTGTRGKGNAHTFGSGSHCDANGTPIASRDNVFVNNVIEQCAAGGLSLYTNTIGTVAAHNTFYKVGRWALMAQYYGSGRVQNNAFSQCEADVVDHGGGSLVADHNVSGDLKFTNPEAGDFTLLKGSPAINAGADVSAWVTHDAAGAKRIAPFDCGAYEYAPVVIIEPPPPDVQTYHVIGDVTVAKDGAITFAGHGVPVVP